MWSKLLLEAAGCDPMFLPTAAGGGQKCCQRLRSSLVSYILAEPWHSGPLGHQDSTAPGQPSHPLGPHPALLTIPAPCPHSALNPCSTCETCKLGLRPYLP